MLLRILTVLISVFLTYSIANAQSEEKECITTNRLHTDSVDTTTTRGNRFINSSKKLFSKAVDWFNATDTTYILPNLYNLTLVLEQSTLFEHYRLGISGDDGSQILGFAPKVNTKLGLYFGWKWIFVGYSFDLGSLLKKEREKSRTEMTLNLYSAKFGLDLYYRKSGNDFRITSCKNFDLSDDYIGTNFSGFQSSIKGLNAYYIFKSKKYSYPAAYSQSTNQKKSCGSLMAGFAYSEHQISFDKSKLPEEIQEQINPASSFRKLNYTDYNISFGYGYNWVFAKNCLLNISLLPAVGYKKARINDMQTTDDYNRTEWVKDINFDLITRAGITWNNRKYYVGATFILHTYDYRKDRISMTNSFGSLKIYAGFNFWKRKK